MERTKIAWSAVFAALALLGWGLGVAAQEGGPNAPPVAEMSGIITIDTETGAVGAMPETYWVPNGYQAELTLNLVVNGTGTAAFATPPVEFPKGEPPQFRWRKVNDTQIVLHELNDNDQPGTEERYYFKARVESGGEVHKSPDPTLINPGPPGG